MKLVLQVQSGSLAGKSHELETGALLLGRGPDCSIQFAGAGDEGVSKNHLRIEVAPDGFYAVDLGSTNGSFINGARIERALLNSSDIIRLGAGNPLILVSIQRNGEAEPRPVPAVSDTPATPAAAGPATVALSPEPESPTGSPPSAPETAALLNVVHGFGGFNPDKDKGGDRSMLGNVLILCGLGAGMLALAIAALLTMSQGGNLISAVTGACAAFAFGPIYLIIWMWLNRYDPAPAWLLAACVLWGGGVACCLAFGINRLDIFAATKILGPQNGPAIVVSLFGPINEETLKGLGVLLIYLCVRREFDGILDGIVFAGVIALGFAIVEDVEYYARGMHAGGIGGLAAVLVTRACFMPFAHALFTSMTGIGCGISRESHNRIVKWLAPPAGYACAVFLHASWNGIITFFGGLGSVIAYFVFYVPLFLILIGFIVWQTIRESKVIRQMLTPEVEQGLLTMQQVGIVSSYMQRIGWLAASLTDLPRLTARRKFLRAATKLALSYWHVNRAAAAQSQTVSGALIPRYRNQVIALKERI